MFCKEQLTKYAKMLLAIGINLQKEQELVISSSIDCAPLVRALTKEAYAMGAKDVRVNWSDSETDKQKFIYASDETLSTIPEWLAEAANGHARRGGAFISVYAADPDAYAGIDPARIAMYSRAMSKATMESMQARMTGGAAWLVASYPSEKWAQKVYPDLKGEEAMKKLWEAILSATRGDAEDPVAAWKQHQENLNKRIKWLNEMNFKAMKYKAANGTDFLCGMAENHIWNGGGSPLKNGLNFVPNMPTEEIFSAPDCRVAEGHVVAALPLSHSGTLIENFWFEFKDGKIVDYGAEKGVEALKGILETDEGALRLGEIALIPMDSPLAKMGTLFYNTLFDENASCHFAVGRAYPDCIKGGEEMKPEELKGLGVNAESLTHVDFMIGTNDLTITGITQDGQEVKVFENGLWAEGTEA